VRGGEVKKKYRQRGPGGVICGVVIPTKSRENPKNYHIIVYVEDGGRKRKKKEGGCFVQRDSYWAPKGSGEGKFQERGIQLNKVTTEGMGFGEAEKREKRGIKLLRTYKTPEIISWEGRNHTERGAQVVSNLFREKGGGTKGEKDWSLRGKDHEGNF